jgi:D-serine deaminase-like pyridoxal phosphate-dependent protein
VGRGAIITVMKLADLPTPALLVDADAFAHNVATMAQRWPGRSLRPHVKAFKSTALAAELVAAGHRSFCAATPREIIGMVRAGIGDDLLLANETLDVQRLGALARRADGGTRVTVAVDSEATVRAAARAGVGEVLVDVGVGMPRCGCVPDHAGRLAGTARGHGLAVRGVMGYEGHLMMADAATKADRVEDAMRVLLAAHDEVGGDVVSGGGTGTWATNSWVTELQAGSYTLMDSDYAKADLPFRQALTVLATVVNVRPGDAGWVVIDAGLKALATDHGDPQPAGGRTWFVSDEHLTWSPEPGHEWPEVGDKVRVVPSHVDPTVNLHETMHVIRGDEVIDTWPIDLRGW